MKNTDSEWIGPDAAEDSVFPSSPQMMESLATMAI